MVLEEIGWEGESWLVLAEVRDSKRAVMNMVNKFQGVENVGVISSVLKELLDFQGFSSLNLIYFDVTAKLLSRGQSDVECCQLNAVQLRSLGQFH